MSIDLVKLVIILSSLTAVVCFCALIMLEQVTSYLYNLWKKHHNEKRARGAQKSTVHVKGDTKLEVFNGGKE